MRLCSAKCERYKECKAINFSICDKCEYEREKDTALVCQKCNTRTCCFKEKE